MTTKKEREEAKEEAAAESRADAKSKRDEKKEEAREAEAQAKADSPEVLRDEISKLRADLATADKNAAELRKKDAISPLEAQKREINKRNS